MKRITLNLLPLVLLSSNLIAFLTPSFDHEGRLTKITLNGFGDVDYFYDETKRLEKVIRHQEDGTIFYQIVLSYDAFNHLIKESIFDDQDRVLAENDFLAEKSLDLDLPDLDQNPKKTPIYFITDQEKKIRYKFKDQKLIASYHAVKDEEIAIFDAHGNLKEFKIPGITILPELTLPLMIEKDQVPYLCKLQKDFSIASLQDLKTQQIYENPKIDPYGQILLKKPVISSFSYRQKIYDEDTKTLFFGHRTYHVESKKWASKDPFGTIQNEDVYCYCGEEPEKFIDPDGRFFFTIPIFPIKDNLVETVIEITKNLLISSIEEISNRVNLYLIERADRIKEEEFLEIQKGIKPTNRKSFSPDILPLDGE